MCRKKYMYVIFLGHEHGEKNTANNDALPSLPRLPIIFTLEFQVFEQSQLKGVRVTININCSNMYVARDVLCIFIFASITLICDAHTIRGFKDAHSS